MDFPKKLYVVSGCEDWPDKEKYYHDESREDANVWTVSEDPEMVGWENDAATPGYGLPKALAEEIVRRWNAYEETP